MNSGDKACESKIFGIKIQIEWLAFSIAFSAVQYVLLFGESFPYLVRTLID